MRPLKNKGWIEDPARSASKITVGLKMAGSGRGAANTQRLQAARPQKAVFTPLALSVLYLTKRAKTGRVKKVVGKIAGTK